MRTIVLGCFAVLAALATAVDASAAVTGTLTPTTTFNFNIRDIDAGPTTGTRTFTVTSTGSDPLTVTSATLTGTNPTEFSISSNTCSAPLATSQTCAVVVVFDPSTTGAKTSTLTVATNGPMLVSNTMSGTGRDLEVSSSAVAFTPRRVGSGPSAAQTVTVTNEDTAPYALGAVSIAGADANQFVKGTDTCSSQTLAASASCTVSLTFSPTSPGEKAATLSLASFTPVLANLTGTGEQPAVAMSPATRSFGSVAPGTGPSAARSFTLTNSGTGPAAIGQAAVTGPNASLFPLGTDGCSNRSLAPGASCTVEVAFSPVDVGWKRATLEIPSDNATTPARARLGGRGAGEFTDPPLAVGLDLAAQPLARWQGDAGDTVGGSLASGPCDVNGDGYDDVIVGAPLWSRRPVDLSWEGGAYVLLGSDAPKSGDLAASGTDRVLIEGEKESSQTGTGVGCAGDVNGDGYDDVLVGAWAYEYDGRPTGTAAARGRAYVVFGAKSFEPLDLRFLGDRGYRIVGPDGTGTGRPEDDHLGYAVTGVGDLDGDGLDDVAVVANTADSTALSRTQNGRAYVIAGKKSATTVDVSVPGATLMTIDGAATSDQILSAQPAGDVTGDGKQDIVLGSYVADPFSRSAAGAAYALSGSTRGSIDLSSLGANGFTVGGAAVSDRLGISTAKAGDVNGDDIDDLLLGGDSSVSGNPERSYVVFGSSSTATVDTASLGSRGYRISSVTPGDGGGFAVDGIGDVNGDGRPDALIGAFGADPVAAGTNAGSAFVVYGKADTSEVLLGSLPSAQGARLDGSTASERFGRSVAGVGDVDGNGTNDIAVGADDAYRFNRDSAGEVTVALLPGDAPPNDWKPPVTPDPPSGGEQPPAGPPPVIPIVRPAPPTSFVKTTGLRAGTGGRVPLQVGCRSTTRTCKVVARLLIGSEQSGRGMTEGAPGVARPVSVTLDSVTRRLVARKRSVKAVLKLIATDANGTSTVRHIRVALRAPAR